VDESGEIGRAYGAKTTPHMYVIDSKGILVYKGAIDDAPNTREVGKTNYVRNVIDAVFGGKAITTKETQSYGCSVKYAS
jgi:hypothetical protein